LETLGIALPSDPNDLRLFLARCSRLINLRIDLSLDLDALAIVVTALPMLRRLQLGDGLTETADQICPSLAHLEWLRLSDTRISSESFDRMLTPTGQATAALEQGTSRNRIKHVTIQNAFADACMLETIDRHCLELTSMEIFVNRIPIEAMGPFASIVSRLERLRTEFFDEDAHQTYGAISHAFSRSSRLRHLDTDCLVECPAVLTDWQCSNLTSLHLRNPITPAALRAVAAKSPKIRTLKLFARYHPARRTLLRGLCDFLPDLAELDVNDFMETDGGAVALLVETHPKLKRIHLENRSYADELWEYVRSQCPDDVELSGSGCCVDLPDWRGRLIRHHCP